LFHNQPTHPAQAKNPTTKNEMASIRNFARSVKTTLGMPACAIDGAVSVRITASAKTIRRGRNGKNM
jgi:hypothetical protein